MLEIDQKTCIEDLLESDKISSYNPIVFYIKLHPQL